MSEETRIVDPLTGGEKGQKLARYGLIPVGPLHEVAELYGLGAKKYSERNWEKAYNWSLSYDAAQRHLNQFWDGESRDSETGGHHLASVIFHCMAMMEFEAKKKGADDRPQSIAPLPTIRPDAFSAEDIEKIYASVKPHADMLRAGDPGVDRYLNDEERHASYGIVTDHTPWSGSTVRGHYATPGGHTDPADECATCAQIDSVR